MARQIITISRQYGSGGREIAEKVASDLGFAYYDKELIRRIADEGSMDVGLVSRQGEGAMGKLSSLLTFAVNATGADEDTLPLAERIFLAQSRAIKSLGEQGKCVIVGHCADYFLADYADTLNVFIIADAASRLQRVMARNNIEEKEALARIRKTDKDRSAYYEQHTNKRWGEAANYDLVLSSSTFGIELSAEIICAIARL
ncbi:MAG: cytidylate kinase-like family protein [Coriobacteriales bacterium]|jgi:cytidylate kinase|nr:cytidylate kinase-like family protein [Coriobacteriales bacterium]